MGRKILSSGILGIILSTLLIPTVYANSSCTG